MRSAFFVFTFMAFEGQVFRRVIVVILQLRKQSLVRQVQRMRVLPVSVGHFM